MDKTNKEETRSFGLTYKLLIWFICVALVPLCVFGTISFIDANKLLNEQCVNQLIALADVKSSEIEDTFYALEEIVINVARKPAVISVMNNYVHSGIDSNMNLNKFYAQSKGFRTFLRNYIVEYKNVHDVFLISIQGDVFYTTMIEDDYRTNLLTGQFKDTQLAYTFNQAKLLSEPKISSFEYYLPSKRVAAFMGMPVLKEGKVIGAVCVQIEEQVLKESSRDYRGLGKTGEIVFCVKEKNHISIIAPLRHDADAAFKKTITIGSDEALPIQRSAMAENGFGTSIDYRGKRIIAVWRYLHYPGWGFVVKMDASEVFGPALWHGFRILILGMAIFVFVVIVSIFLSRSISNPIIKLTNAIKTITSEGLSNKKVEIKSSDEIGQLAQSFNAMITNLNQSEEKIMNSLEEKEILLAEIHHRVKNNMQIISSILHLQSNLTKDNKLTEIMNDSQNRIQSMALVHEQLYESKDFSKISIQGYLNALVIKLIAVYEQKAGMVTTKIEAEGIQLSIDTVIPIGLITNELVTNSMKYAFQERKGNQIKVALNSTAVEGEYELIVRDNGIGIQEDFDISNTKKLGLMLVTNLTEMQLNGKVEVKRGKGTEFRIKFKEIKKP